RRSHFGAAIGVGVQVFLCGEIGPAVGRGDELDGIRVEAARRRSRRGVVAVPGHVDYANAFDRIDEGTALRLPGSRILETPGRVVDRIDARNTGVNDHRGVQRGFQAQAVGDALIGPAVQDLVRNRDGKATTAGEVVSLHDQGTDLVVRRVLGIDDE